jgi:hypothetical protein
MEVPPPIYAILRLGEAAFQIDRELLKNSCELFKLNPVLAEHEYFIHTNVPEALFADFLYGIEKGQLQVSPVNLSGLWSLSIEFGFRMFLSAVAEFGDTPNAIWDRFCELNHCERSQPFILRDTRFDSSTPPQSKLHRFFGDRVNYLLPDIGPEEDRHSIERKHQRFVDFFRK